MSDASNTAWTSSMLKIMKWENDERKNAKQSTQTIIASPSMNINWKTTDRQAYEQLRNSYSTVQR